MNWFLDMLDPENAAKAIIKAPGEALSKPLEPWSNQTRVVVGVGTAAAIVLLIAVAKRKSYAQGAASRGGADVERSGLEAMYFGVRQSDTMKKIKRAEAAKAAAEAMAAKRLAAARG